MSTFSPGFARRKRHLLACPKKRCAKKSYFDVGGQTKVTSLSPGINLNQQTLTATVPFNARPGDELAPSEDWYFCGVIPLSALEGYIEVDIIIIIGLSDDVCDSWTTLSVCTGLRDSPPNDLP